MLRRVLTTLLLTALVGGSVITLTATTASAADPWRVSARCTQGGVLKVRLTHDLNAAGRERIRSEFRAYTAVGQQTWDFKTKINGVLWSKGAATTDDSGDLRVQVNRAEADQPVVISLSFDATNRVTGERCRMTVAVPPVGQPLEVDLDPWFAQGFCTQGTPWTLRVQDHVRTNSMEEIWISLRLLDGEADQRRDTKATIDDGGSQLQLDVAEVSARHHTTGEICKVSIDVLPLP